MYRKDEGGGYMMGMGSHDIDFVCGLFGEPAAVCADVRTTIAERPRADGSMLAVDADDTAMLLLRMANGTIVNIMTTAVALHRRFRSFEAYGSKGSLFMDTQLMGETPAEVHAGSVDQPSAVVVPNSDRRPRSGIEPPKRRAAGSIVALALMLEDWLPALSGGTADVPTLRDGHRVQRVVDAARESSAGGGWVSLLA